MVGFLIPVCIVLSTAVLLLFIKILLLYRDAAEISAGFAEKVKSDTNTLISLAGNDRVMNRVADEMNASLQELYKLRQRYRNGDRELKEAVAGMSHDLRTPLTAICGWLDLLGKEEKSGNVARYLGYIENGTESLKQLTEELFHYSVMLSASEDMRCETVNINAVLEESIAAFYAALTERGITPAIAMPGKKVERQLNKAALSRIFSNLLNNALKYSDGDLSITLSESGEILFSNTASRLGEIEAGRLFDRFFSVQAASNSTGLGLAIAKTLVERMNGTIAAQYKENRLSIRVGFTEK